MHFKLHCVSCSGEMNTISSTLVSFLLLISPLCCFGSYKPYDYLKLSLTWTNTFCIKEACCNNVPADKFTIHGLWPTNVTTIVENCSGSPYIWLGPRSALYRQLSGPWMNLAVIQCVSQDYRADNIFWRRQWEKHGVCAELHFRSQQDYFKKAVELRSRFAFEDLGGSIGRPYSLHEWDLFFLKMTGRDVDFDCYYDATNVLTVVL